jgi:hypothetical protein
MSTTETIDEAVNNQGSILHYNKVRLEQTSSGYFTIRVRTSDNWRWEDQQEAEEVVEVVNAALRDDPALRRRIAEVNNEDCRRLVLQILTDSPWIPYAMRKDEDI